MFVEVWLERVYGKAVARVKAMPKGVSGSRELRGSDKTLAEGSMRDCTPSERQALASRPPSSAARSSRYEVDSERVEGKI